MYFLFSDVHGCLEEMEVLLSKWNPEKEKLVYLGDMVDRGPDSLGVIRRLMALKKEYPQDVIILKGNHDDDFAHWIYLEESVSFLMTEDIKTTVKSFYKDNPEKLKKDSRIQQHQYIRRNFKQEISFINNLPLYHETNHCIFVHAGIDVTKDDWKDDGVNTFLWIRNQFIYNDNKMPKKVFFGHTATSFLHKDCNDIYIGKHNDRIGIDGGCVFGGQLNGLKIDKEGNIIEEIKVQKIIN
jgi:serine/threonine protein phosphatase 1